MRRRWLLAAIAALGGCSFALDFDDETDLPCDQENKCRPNFVCLVSQNRCVPTRSVDPFKSCNTDALVPDDLCKVNHLCYDLEGRGHRCLPMCEPTNFSTPDVGAFLRQQCPVGTSCWAIPEGGGLCDEGECTDNPNTCPPPQSCVVINGAGRCFTPCRIFTPGACAGDELCHPIGATNTVACIKAGSRQLYEVCDDENACAQVDSLGRPMVCDRPEGSGDQRRCLASCVFGSNAACVAGEQCAFARPNIDPESGASLGVCIGG